MLRPGDNAPEFDLPDASGGRVRLSALLGGGPVVLAFYPADFTPVCTAQACMMRDQHDRLIEAGYRVVAISSQSADSHARFAARHALAQTLLADTEREAIRAYGVGGPLGITRRVTFLITRGGRITDRVVSDLRVGPHRRMLSRLIGTDAGRPERSQPGSPDKSGR